jgi:hypothetical protein
MGTEHTPKLRAICLQVVVNGKRLAVAGVKGEGNVNAHVWWSRTKHYGEGPRASGAARLRVAGGDFNDPVWDRLIEWLDHPLELGDRVEIAVVHSQAPDRGSLISRDRRIPVDEYPCPRNPTAVTVRGAAVYALTDTVGLWVGNKRSPRTAQLTPGQARKIGRGLLAAADAVQKRTRRSLPPPRGR